MSTTRGGRAGHVAPPASVAAVARSFAAPFAAPFARRPVAAALVVLAGSLVAPGAVRAEESRWNLRLELGPEFTIDQPSTITSTEQVATGGLDLRLGLELEPHERIGVEVMYDTSFLFDQANVLNTQQAFLLGLRFRPWYAKDGGYLYPRTAKPIVFLNDVLSDAWIDAHLGISLANRNRFIYDVGIGARVAVIWPIQLGVFVRWQQLLALGTPDETSFKQIVAGVTLDAGFQPVHMEPDSDGDGVPDARDRCPDTPRGARVNAVGCPVVEDAAPGGPICSDEDLDGVCDGEDQCPDTPYGVKVDAKGCPLGGEGGASAPPEGAPPPRE